MTFEARLADAYERYLAVMPTAIDPQAIAAQAARARPAARFRLTLRPGLAKLVLAAVLLLGLAVGVAVVGNLLDTNVPILPEPSASHVAPWTTVRPLAFEFPVLCGPIHDADLCQRAIELALTENQNVDRIVDVRVRLPGAEFCAEAAPPCDSETVVVAFRLVTESSAEVALLEVPMRRSGDGWILR